MRRQFVLWRRQESDLFLQRPCRILFALLPNQFLLVPIQRALTPIRQLRSHVEFHIVLFVSAVLQCLLCTVPDFRLMFAQPLQVLVCLVPVVLLRKPVLVFCCPAVPVGGQVLLFLVLIVLCFALIVQQHRLRRFLLVGTVQASSFESMPIQCLLSEEKEVFPVQFPLQPFECDCRFQTLKIATLL